MVVTGPRPSVTRTETGPFGRVMVITLADSVWDANAPRQPSSADAVGNMITIHLGSIDDLAAHWSRAITTLMTVKVTR